MKKETIVFAVVALIIGVLGGIIYSNWQRDTAQPAAGGGAPPSAAGVPLVNYQQQINTLEGILAREPENRNAWVQLGNNYYGSDQAIKAIEAYDKALELGPDDPNVLTDQGTMFRRVGWYDRAVNNFQRAAELDPNHVQSRYNMGVVYRYDLQDFPKAIAAWESFLALNPGGNVEQIRTEVDFMKNHPPMPQAPRP
ncbi:tetratricopeptide repeat protein [Pelovirga terrestris]|uniref:Tetratricopeptide repeat protein n=1 Tax=Pelovirga terrestris TaxID=2771352 RepID=A0A8J6QNL6_9BACT|nr:tetratricopeptide repeat protein [Pelovirga terrestris]MBD1400972.1 tetratricopeptide repeat protein [Pelovirga terrestris]